MRFKDKVWGFPPRFVAASRLLTSSELVLLNSCDKVSNTTVTQATLQILALSPDHCASTHQMSPTFRKITSLLQAGGEVKPMQPVFCVG